MSGIDPYDPEVSRRNKRLALILVGIILLVITAFIVRFTLAGLPPDRKEWERIQQRESRYDVDEQLDQAPIPQERQETPESEPEEMPSDHPQSPEVAP